MKDTRTLKVEIIPTGPDRAAVYRRLRALRQALPLALNFAFRDVYPSATGQLEAILDGDSTKAKQLARSWQNDVRKRLTFHWTRQLQRSLEFRGRGKKKVPAADPEAFRPALAVLCTETIDCIVSRFKGEHLKDLLAGRAGLPNLSNRVFYSEGRVCELTGSIDAATMTFPLWATGKKSTSFEVVALGRSARATLRGLLRAHEQRRTIVDLEAKARRGTESERRRASAELDAIGAMKMGRVGIVYNERKRKWFALISWTRYGDEGYEPAQSAACNFGCNVFIHALSEGGDQFVRPGYDVQEARGRFHAMRRRRARCIESRGSGARGRGKKNRFRAITKLGDAEARWVKSWIRMMAADLLKWCKKHEVSDLYLEDLSGIRDTFDDTGTGAFKRFIHEWPFYETQQAIALQARECGVRVHQKVANLVSQRCPHCGHTAPENTRTRDVLSSEELREFDGQLWKRVERRSWFECQECALTASTDLIACANHLVDVGCKHPLEKFQKKASKKDERARGLLESPENEDAAE